MLGRTILKDKRDHCILFITRKTDSSFHQFLFVILLYCFPKNLWIEWIRPFLLPLVTKRKIIKPFLSWECNIWNFSNDKGVFFVFTDKAVITTSHSKLSYTISLAHLLKKHVNQLPMLSSITVNMLSFMWEFCENYLPSVLPQNWTSFLHGSPSKI